MVNRRSATSIKRRVNDHDSESEVSINTVDGQSPGPKGAMERLEKTNDLRLGGHVEVLQTVAVGAL